MNYSKLFGPGLFFIAALFLFSLWQRVPDVDDAWIGEHAYWLAEKGYVKSELMHGITGQHERHLVHHKLFTLNGWAFIKVFGFSLITLKSVSLLWVIIFLFIFFKYCVERFDRKVAWLGLLLLSVNAFIFQYSFVFRPEIMVLTLGFVSFIAVEKYLSDGNKWLVVLAGVTAGLAASAHLNGLIFIGAGSLVLLWKRKPVASVILAFSSLIGLAVYFYDFSSEYNFAYWYYQLNDSPALHKSSVVPSSVQYLLKILREHLRFFHSPKEIVMSLLMLFAIIVNFKDLKNNTIYLHYLVLLVVLLSLISVHTTSKYLLLYLPVIMLIILRSLGNIWRGEVKEPRLVTNPKKQIKVVGVLLLLYFGVHLTYDVLISVNKYNTRANAAITEKYFANNTSQLNILAPMEFIFNEIPKYNRIQSDLSIAEMQKRNEINGSSFFSLMDSLQIDGIILSDEYKRKFGLMMLDEEDVLNGSFVKKGEENGYTFLVRQTENIKD
jgi:4-amino-4-deoxy-L-arabinose transferase-like glycosyltransferase